jgi:hypothetical protein
MHVRYIYVYIYNIKKIEYNFSDFWLCDGEETNTHTEVSS